MSARHNLEAIAQAIYGRRWQAELAADCGLTTREIRRWHKKPQMIKPHMRHRIRMVAERRLAACAAALADLRMGIKLEDKPPHHDGSEPTWIKIKRARKSTHAASPEVTPPAALEAPVVEAAPVIRVIPRPMRERERAAIAAGTYRAPEAAKPAAEPVRTRQIATIADVPSFCLTDEQTRDAIAEMQAFFDARFEEETARAASASEPEVVAEPEPELPPALIGKAMPADWLNDYYARGAMRRRIMEAVGVEGLIVGDEIDVGSRIWVGGLKRARVVRIDGGDVYIRIEYGDKWRKESLLEAAKFCGLRDRAGIEQMVDAAMAEATAVSVVDRPQADDVKGLRRDEYRRLVGMVEVGDLLTGDTIQIAGDTGQLRRARVTRIVDGEINVEISDGADGWSEERRLDAPEFQCLFDRVGLKEAITARYPDDFVRRIDREGL